MPSNMSLNPKIITESFEAVKPIAGEAADYFYNVLFTKYPEVKTLFANTEMAKQKNHLISSLVFIVENLERADVLSAVLKKMGARHVKYGVKPEHYPMVGETLLETFAHFFGDLWSSELKEQWTLAYGAISSLMLEGAPTGTKVAIVTGASRGIGHGIAERLLEKGYCVVANSRNITLAETWRPGDQLKLIDGDIGSPDVAKQVMDSAIDNFGRIDLLVNNAGVFIPKPFTEFTAEDFRRATDTNLGGFL